jgi:pyruvate kinase
MRSTKIVCTIGPASASDRMLERLIRAGMNVARLNFSHGSYASHRRVIKLFAVSNARVEAQTNSDLTGLARSQIRITAPSP